MKSKSELAWLIKDLQDFCIYQHKIDIVCPFFKNGKCVIEGTLGFTPLEFPKITSDILIKLENKEAFKLPEVLSL